MRYLLVFVIACVTVGCTATTHIDDSVFDALTGTAATVKWGGIEIGMSHSEAERALGSPLARVNDDFTEACGSTFTTTGVAGRPTQIQWADEAPHQIESIVVSLRPTDITPRVRNVVRDRVKGAKQPCRAPETSALPVCFRHQSGTAVWVSAEHDPVLRITLDDCTD